MLIILALAAYVSWSMGILVTGIIESMKWSESKQQAAYIFTGYIALAPSLPSLAGFAVQSLLAVSPCQLASMEEGRSWKYHCP